MDALGNLIAVKGKKPKVASGVMVSAHIDEIGLMVTHVEKDGFLRVTNVGGVNPLTCIGGRVLFMNGTQGVIGVSAVKGDSRPKITDLFVDVGATSKEDCPVKVGDVCGLNVLSSIWASGWSPING